MTSRSPVRGVTRTARGPKSRPVGVVVLGNLLAGLTACVILVAGLAASDAIVAGPPRFSDPVSYAELGAVWGQLLSAVLPVTVLVGAYYAAIRAALLRESACIRRARLWSLAGCVVVVAYLSQALWLGAWRSLSANEMLLLLGTTMVLVLPLTINIGFFASLLHRARRTMPA